MRRLTTSSPSSAKGKRMSDEKEFTKTEIDLAFDCAELEIKLRELQAECERLKARCEELEKPRASITDTPFTVENITIDQRYKFEQEIKKLTEEINFLKEARSKSAKLVCEDCGCALARF